ncbi:MAG: hypothetical protein ACREFB_00240, partial [Stellaceae bacterium]
LAAAQADMAAQRARLGESEFAAAQARLEVEEARVALAHNGAVQRAEAEGLRIALEANKAAAADTAAKSQSEIEAVRGEPAAPVRVRRPGAAGAIGWVEETTAHVGSGRNARAV